MAQLDALNLAEAVRQRLVEFVVDDSFTRDPELARIARELWGGVPEKGGLLSELWIEGNFPAAESEMTLERLAEEGRFDRELCEQLDRSGGIPKRRRLYTHQYEALQTATGSDLDGQRPAMVVSADTGSGKTEAFMLPILNELSAGNSGVQDGTRCVILYPMNALVNDQVDRLYEWLRGQDRIRLFSFTSETPEDTRAANRAGIPRWDACRVRTRNEAREAPVPDILITNYSMLEYMLCRPQDSVFFGPALRAVVLDEAHLYTGTLAAELTLLLRRLLLRCGVASEQVLQIATSATLGTRDPAELRDFAAELFSKDTRLVHTIEGKAATLPFATPQPPDQEPSAASVAETAWIERPLIEMDGEGNPYLTEDPEVCRRLADSLATWVSPKRIAALAAVERRPAVWLWEALSASPWVHRLGDILWTQRRISLDELAGRLWGTHDADTTRATIALLHLTASARRQAGDYPLVPHRIHLMARANDGLNVCLSPNCAGSDRLKLKGLGAVHSGFSDQCPECAGAVLGLYRCANCGEWVLAGSQQQGALRSVPPGYSPSVEFFALHSTPANRQLVVDPESAICSGAGGAGVDLFHAEECPGCGQGTGSFVPFSSRSNLFLSILAETVLAELPPYPSDLRHWLPAGGRRLLAFSDSRQGAARLGPTLTRQHDTQVLRASIVRCMRDTPVGDEPALDRVTEMIESTEAVLMDSRLSPGERQVLETTQASLRDQLRSMTVGGSMEAWARALAGQKLMEELLDQGCSKTQEALVREADRERRWSQREWDKNATEVRKTTKVFLAREFARLFKRDTSLEVLGLAEVTYPGLDGCPAPAAFLGQLPDDRIRRSVSEVWGLFLAALCDSLRMDGAITVADDADLQRLDISYISRWCVRRGDSRSYLATFIGQTAEQRRRRFAAAVLRAAGMEEERSVEAGVQMLETAFDQLLSRAVPEGEQPGEGQLPWLRKSLRQTRQGPPAEAVQILFDHLGLRRPAQLFQCGRTGHVWPRSVLGCAPEVGCEGALTPIDSAALEMDPRLGRYRREYDKAAVFQMGLWAEEHSAQLAPAENRRLQDLFKFGIRNVLSATTTLELGVDIGGLNAVLMANVPPGKSNYLQRAGRAGRRSDGSSVVITYVRPQPYDREVFHRIGDYLGRPLRKPLVLLDRDRVVRRHAYSFLLGSFFQKIYPSDLRVGAMAAFGNMGRFCGALLPPYWERGQTKPKASRDPGAEVGNAASLPWMPRSGKIRRVDLCFTEFLRWQSEGGDGEIMEQTKQLVEDTRIAAEVEPWAEFMQATEDAFNEAVRAWEDEYQGLLRAWKRTEDRSQANAIRYQLRTLHGLTVIEALAD